MRIGALEIPQPLLFEAGADARAQLGRIEGFGQVILGAGVEAAHDARRLVQRRDHDHRESGGPRRRLDPLQDLVAVDLGHHQVEQDQVERALRQQFQCLEAAGRGLDLMAEALEAARQDSEILRRVVDG